MKQVYDIDPEKIGKQIGNFTVQNSNEMFEAIRNAGIKIAMVAVPETCAQEVTNKLIEAGVRAILNYAPISLNVPPDVYVQYIDPSLHLQRMTYYLE